MILCSSFTKEYNKKGGMFGAAIGALAAGSPIQKGLESTFGVVQNPYLEMMFSGIGFRQFQFVVTFPQNYHGYFLLKCEKNHHVVLI